MSDQILYPVQPRVSPKDKNVTYVPVASYDTVGIASYDKNFFTIDNGKVTFNDAYLKTIITDLVREAAKLITTQVLGDSEELLTSQKLVTDELKKKVSNTLLERIGPFPIVQRDTDLVNIKMTGTPSKDDHVPNLKYLKYNYIPLDADGATGNPYYDDARLSLIPAQLFGTSTVVYIPVASEVNYSNSIVRRTSNGQIRVAQQPIVSNDAASKKYVDDYVKNYVNEKFTNFDFLSTEIVSDLTKVTSENTIYLIPYEEEGYNTNYIYVLVDGEPENIGTTNVDLRDYVKRTEYRVEVDELRDDVDILKLRSIQVVDGTLRITTDVMNMVNIVKNDTLHMLDEETSVEDEVVVTDGEVNGNTLEVELKDE